MFFLVTGPNSPSTDHLIALCMILVHFEMQLNKLVVDNCNDGHTLLAVVVCL